jgi:dimethylhistidine N-methyltransferase
MIEIANKEFAKEVLEGLSTKPKKLSSKYFYDDLGDKIFQEIMRMDEYYLTNSEFEILSMHKADLLKEVVAAFGEMQFQLIEFGAGDGFKTKIILKHLLNSGIQFTYRPVDISASVLDQLQNELSSKLAGLKVDPWIGTYTNSLKELEGEQRKLLFFLGSNLGNFGKEEAGEFIAQVFQRLESGDLVFFGIDLKKDPKTILEAYNDPKGITKAFNLNILRRINRELGGNFNLADFDHYPIYDPATGLCKSYLISKKRQKVEIAALGKEFNFQYAEEIQTEVSIKYGIEEIEALFSNAGFEKREHFFDCKHYFVDTLWIKP